MSIKGIEGLPGLGWVDWFMDVSALVRLPLLAGSNLLLVLVPWWLGAELAQVVSLLIIILLTGTLQACLVILSIGAQNDLELGNRLDLANKLAPEPRSKFKEPLIGIVVGVCILTYLALLFDERQAEWLLIFDSSYYTREHAGNIAIEWVLNMTVFAMSVMLTYLGFFCHRQGTLFHEWASEADIDLMHIEDHQVFALQPLRYLLITVIFVSLTILSHQILSISGQGDAALAVMLPIMAYMFLIGIALVGPLSQIKDRIHDCKANELTVVRAAVAGDRAGLQNSQIAKVADEFAAPDLMMYEQYVRSIWEWPIQGSVQRILFYVLLPPLAWILAAFVEIFVEGAIQ